MATQRQAKDILSNAIGMCDQLPSLEGHKAQYPECKLLREYRRKKCAFIPRMEAAQGKDDNFLLMYPTLAVNR